MEFKEEFKEEPKGDFKEDLDRDIKRELNRDIKFDNIFTLLLLSAFLRSVSVLFIVAKFYASLMIMSVPCTDVHSQSDLKKQLQ